MTDKPIIHSIFPIPIYTTKMNRGFTKQELQFVKKQKKHCINNKGNINTKDNYILNRKQFKNIKKFLDKCCKDYLDTIICPKNNVELYIPQSWLNYTKTNEYHHQHTHTNSFISGVLYFLADPNLDSITFCNEKHQAINIKPKLYNLFNSTTYSYESGNFWVIKIAIKSSL